MPYSFAHTEIVSTGADTEDDIIPTTVGKCMGFGVFHDGTNDVTVELFDGTVAAGTAFFKHIFTKEGVPGFMFGDGVQVAKLSALTTVSGGAATLHVYHRA